MLRITGLSALRPDGGLIRRILRVGIPAGIENGMFQIGKLSVASLTSTLGTAAIAANAVANTTSTFLNIPANAVSMAVLTVVGQCLGAGEKEQAVWYARRLLLVAYCGAWVMNLSGFFFADRWALSWFNLSPEASAMALEVMMWFNIVSLFFWPSSFTLPNILRSAGDASFTMAVSIVSMWVFRVGFCYLWVLRMGGGLLSIWMGMYLDWVFRSLCFAVRFVRGRWLEKRSSETASCFFCSEWQNEGKERRRSPMLFHPAQLGLAHLDKATLEADKKACKKIGPCGVAKKPSISTASTSTAGIICPTAASAGCSSGSP